MPMSFGSSPSIPAYSASPTSAAATGAVLAQGPATFARLTNDTGPNQQSLTGALAYPQDGTAPDDATAGATVWVLSDCLRPVSTTVSRAYVVGGKGTKMKVKGRFVASSDTPFVAGAERFGVGILLASALTGANQLVSFASETETTRDDIATVAAIVDDSENLKGYNCAAAGDATYADPSSGAATVDLTAGVAFELTVEIPSTANTDDDIDVTITVGSNTVYSAAAPVSTSATNDGYIPIVRMNLPGIVTNLYYEVSKAA